ncbi:hypothetical protein DL769_011602 [Monosporascus sp. CRB-8-3]|nr:hypothetical protein DL769_011602 [Monosporascus sp. CRB-8-3]
MSSERKGKASTSGFEIDSQDIQYQSRLKTIRLADSMRIGLTGLALLSGLAILGTSADALAVYNATHLPSEYHLPLWPVDFDLRPTIALVTGSAIVVVVSAVSLVFSKAQALRSRSTIHMLLMFAAPSVGFAATMIAMIFFYAVNASTKVDTLQSWSCQWGYAHLTVKPHFGMLCRESKTALYLSVILVPVELIILMLAGCQFVLLRKAIGISHTQKSSSPALS